MLHPSCGHSPTAAELSRPTSVSRESLTTLLFLPSHFSSINHLYIPACYLLIYPCIVSNCSPFLPFFYSYVPMLACKWLNNLSGVSVMNLPVQKNVKIKRSVSIICYTTLSTTIVFMQEFTFGSAFLPSYTYIFASAPSLVCVLLSPVNGKI